MLFIGIKGNVINCSFEDPINDFGHDFNLPRIDGDELVKTVHWALQFKKEVKCIITKEKCKYVKSSTNQKIHIQTSIVLKWLIALCPKSFKAFFLWIEWIDWSIVGTRWHG